GCMGSSVCTFGPGSLVLVRTPASSHAAMSRGRYRTARRPTRTNGGPSLPSLRQTTSVRGATLHSSAACSVVSSGSYPAVLIRPPEKTCGTVRRRAATLAQVPQGGYVDIAGYFYNSGTSR